MSKVMVFGSFDMMHPGHISFLKQAKRYGDDLIVVVARDSTIEKMKGKPPKYGEKQRIEHVRDLKLASKVVLGYEADPYEIIEEHNPNIICLGYDQDSFCEGLKEELERREMFVEITRLRPYREDIYKSSKLKG